MQTIKELWYGNVSPCDSCGSHDMEVNRLLCLMDRNREELEKTATPQQKETFEKYIDCADEYAQKMMELAFRRGFCLASRFMAESLTAEI